MEKERYIVEIEDLVSNLIIEFKVRNIKNYVTYDEIDKYAANIIKQLRLENIDLIIDMNRYKTNRFFQVYSDFFEESKDETKIILKENVSEEDLINEFRGYLPFNLLLTMIDDNVVTESIIYIDKENNKTRTK